jgi:hypothetical protein
MSKIPASQLLALTPERRLEVTTLRAWLKAASARLLEPSSLQHAANIHQASMQSIGNGSELDVISFKALCSSTAPSPGIPCAFYFVYFQCDRPSNRSAR